jgi:hypothetical protein
MRLRCVSLQAHPLLAVLALAALIPAVPAGWTPAALALAAQHPERRIARSG